MDAVGWNGVEQDAVELKRMGEGGVEWNRSRVEEETG